RKPAVPPAASSNSALSSRVPLARIFTGVPWNVWKRWGGSVLHLDLELDVGQGEAFVELRRGQVHLAVLEVVAQVALQLGEGVVLGGDSGVQKAVHRRLILLTEKAGFRFVPGDLFLFGVQFLVLGLVLHRPLGGIHRGAGAGR